MLSYYYFRVLMTKGNSVKEENICVRADATAEEVLAKLQVSGVGICVVIAENGSVLGTITDGDCRRAFLRGDSVQTSAQRMMNTNFLVVDETFSLIQIEALMQRNGVDQVPVVNMQNQFVDLILSERRRSIRPTHRANPVVILAGGKGRRLLPLTKDTPKPMLEVGGQPLLEHLVTSLVASGFENIFFSVNYLAHIIESHFGDGADWGCSIKYLRETTELGTGGPLKLLGEYASDSILVVNGDLVTKTQFHSLMSYHQQESNVATVCSIPYHMEVPFGVLELNREGVVNEIIEKPRYTVPVSAGIYVLEPYIVNYIPSNTLYPITSLLEGCLSRGERVGCFHLHEQWKDIGTPHHYLEAQELIE